MKYNNFFKTMILAGFVGSTSILAGCTTTSQLAENAQPVGQEFRHGNQICQQYYIKKDPNNILGTLGGAALGGFVGSQIGSNTGKTIATAAGTLGGGLAGNQIQGRANQGHYDMRCRDVYDNRYQDYNYRYNNNNNYYNNNYNDNYERKSNYRGYNR